MVRFGEGWGGWVWEGHGSVCVCAHEVLARGYKGGQEVRMQVAGGAKTLRYADIDCAVDVIFKVVRRIHLGIPVLDYRVEDEHGQPLRPIRRRRRRENDPFNGKDIVSLPIVKDGQPYKQLDIKERELANTRLREFSALVNPKSKHSFNIDQSWLKSGENVYGKLITEDLIEESNRLNENLDDYEIIQRYNINNKDSSIENDFEKIINEDDVFEKNKELNVKVEYNKNNVHIEEKAFNEDSILNKELKFKEELKKIIDNKKNNSLRLTKHPFLASASTVKFPEPLEMRSKIRNSEEKLKFNNSSTYHYGNYFQTMKTPWTVHNIKLASINKLGKPIFEEDKSSLEKNHLESIILEQGFDIPLQSYPPHYLSKNQHIKHIDTNHKEYLNNISKDVSKYKSLIIYEDEDIFILRDPLPKAEYQFICTVKDDKLQKFSDLNKKHISLIEKMNKKAELLESHIHSKYPTAGKFLWGFMSIPQFNRIHMHIISMDYSSDFLRNRAKSGTIHFNSLSNRNFFKSKDFLIESLMNYGTVTINEKYVITQLIKNPICPCCGVSSHELNWMLDHIQKRHVLQNEYEPFGEFKFE